MSFDSHANFSYSTVATAPSPASSGTSLVVQAGDGAKFPTAPFNATVWPAGVQPTSDVAEIVRVTAKSTDTFTITRAQESSSARNIGVGDQIAATITAKVITDIENAGDIVYVPDATGTAATDSANIQAAHDALPSTGGIVQLGRGAYALGTSNPALTFSKPITLRGHGRGPNRAGSPVGYSTTDAQTILQYGSTTGTAISITTTDTFVLQDFAIVNTAAATPPSAGAGIAVTGSGSSAFQFIDISVVGFYRCVDVQQGSEWIMDRCYIGDFVTDGVRIQNLAAADTGDMTICNSWFYCGPHTLSSPNGIQWLSGGGLRIENNKFNNLPAVGMGGQAIYFNPAASVVTSDLFVIGNSIENYNYGVAFASTPGASSSVSKIIVSANEIYAANQCVALATSSTGFWSYITILDNVFSGSGSATGLNIDKVDHVTYGPNTYGTGLTTNVTVGTGATNVSVGDPGREVGYDQITTNATITSTNSASPTALITCASHVFDGTPVMLEVFAQAIHFVASTAGDVVQLTVSESGTVISDLATFITGDTASAQIPVIARLRFTPTAGSHTYVIGGWKTAAGDTGTMIAGSGTGGNSAPAFARFVKV